MILKLVEFHIICDKCGINGNLSDLKGQYPPELNPPERNPLEVGPNILSLSETKKAAKELGWKTGREHWCPRCLAEEYKQK